jgi:hypothetical protein
VDISEGVYKEKTQLQNDVDTYPKSAATTDQNDELNSLRETAGHTRIIRPNPSHPREV